MSDSVYCCVKCRSSIHIINYNRCCLNLICINCKEKQHYKLNSCSSSNAQEGCSSVIKYIKKMTTLNSNHHFSSAPDLESIKHRLLELLRKPCWGHFEECNSDAIDGPYKSRQVDCEICLNNFINK